MPSITSPLCCWCQVVGRVFFETGFDGVPAVVPGRRLVPGPGVACPKSRCLGCEPAALATESFPGCPPGPWALRTAARADGTLIARATGNTIGGSFTTVRNAGSSTDIPRLNLFAFNATTGEAYTPLTGRDEVGGDRLGVDAAEEHVAVSSEGRNTRPPAAGDLLQNRAVFGRQLL